MSDDVNPLGVDQAAATRSLYDVAGIPEPPAWHFDTFVPSPEDAARARARRAQVEQDRADRYAVLLRWHDKNMVRWSVGPLAKGLLELHRPELVRGEPDAVCTGCDPRDEACLPEFPCRTYVFVARYIGALLDERGRPVFDG